MTHTSTIIAALKDIKGKHIDVTELKEIIKGDYYNVVYSKDFKKGDETDGCSERSK